MRANARILSLNVVRQLYRSEANNTTRNHPLLCNGKLKVDTWKPPCIYLLLCKYDILRYEVSTVKKGQKRRMWTKAQKLEIIHKHLDEHISLRTLEKECQADRSD